jgi:hypothetical protein
MRTGLTDAVQGALSWIEWLFYPDALKELLSNLDGLGEKMGIT